MRKIFTTLKSVVAATVISAMALATSCSYDDSLVQEQINDIKQDLAALTERVEALEKALPEQVASLEQLINGKVVVTGVETVNGVTTVTLSDGSSFQISEAAAGADYTIGAYAEGDAYYWAIFKNGNFEEFLLVNGEKVAVFAEGEACELQMEVREDGKLYVSIDGGANWVSTELPAAAVAGACVFESVVVNEDGSVTFTFADGTSFDVAYAELVEFEAAKSAVYVKIAETISIPFAINDAVQDINVMNQPLGWKASVEQTRAVGGMDFALNITGPAKDFAQYADKSGKVSIHFNTAAGACKVMSVDVELAAIDLQVDKAGNITIVNTLVDKYDRENWGVTEHIEEFNNYYFAVVNIDDYEACGGDLESVYNSNWGEFNIAAAASYIQNFFTNVGENGYENAIFQDGVNEKWTVNFTVAEAIEYLDWYGQMSYEGNSFMVCVIPTDVKNAGNLIWDEMVAVPFKQLALSIVENVDARVYNNAYFDVTLRGGVAYHLYPMSMKDVNDYVEVYGYYPSMEDLFWDYLNSYLMYPNWYSFGFEIAEDVVEENISLSDLLAYTYDYYSFETKPATDYVMALFTWEDGKTEYSIDDLKFFYFSTAALTAAETALEASYELNEDHGLYTVAVDLTVDTKASSVYTRWYDEEMEETDMLQDLIDNGYGRDAAELEANQYCVYVGTSVSDPGTQKYLGVLVIDAEGNYTTHQFAVKSNELVINETYVPTIESVTFDSEGAHITVGGIEGADVKGFQYYIIATDGSSYYQKTEADCYDVAYSSSWLYQSSETNPILATRTADYTYSFVEGKTYKVAVGVQFADGTYSNCAYGEFAYAAEGGDEPGGGDEPEVKDPSNSVYNYAYTYGDWDDCTVYVISEDESYAIVMNFYGIIPYDKGYIPEGTYDFGSWYGAIYTGGYSYVYDYSTQSNSNIYSGEVAVSEVDGKYRLVISAQYGDTMKQLNATYEGTIDGIILPSEYVPTEPEPEPDPDNSALNPVRAEYDNKFDLYEYNGGDAEYAFWLYDANNNYVEVIHRFGSHTGWDDVYEAKLVKDGVESVATSVQTQAPNTWNCNAGELYFVVIATFENGESVAIQEQLPATEVNYLGEGSNYAPGSEPSEGGDEDEQEPEETVYVELMPYEWFKSYSGGNELEIGWFDQDGYSIMIDFLMNPITPGTYTLSNGLSGMYTKYRGIGMTSCTAVVTDAGDGQLAFDVTFKAQIEGVFTDYHFTWVGDPTTL